MARFDETLKQLREKAEEHECVAVAYSDGKDSRVVMDLCLRTFKRVEAFFMYFVPGLECVENGIVEAEIRHGIKIHRVMHWAAQKCLKQGIYCDPWYGYDAIPEFKLRDIYDYAKLLTGATIVATGAKNADSAWRRRFMHATRNWDDIYNPIADWTKFDVIAFLKGNGIPLPDSSGATATGVDLSTEELLYMHDKHPADFERLSWYFPYIHAVIKRRELYPEIFE